MDGSQQQAIQFKGVCNSNPSSSDEISCVSLTVWGSQVGDSMSQNEPSQSIFENYIIQILMLKDCVPNSSLIFSSLKLLEDLLNGADGNYNKFELL